MIESNAYIRIFTKSNFWNRLFLHSKEKKLRFIRVGIMNFKKIRPNAWFFFLNQSNSMYFDLLL